MTNPQFPLASGDQFIEGNRNWEAQLGFFGRLNYSFEDRYFVEANIRRDGSSKFPKHLRWKWFPSFSAGWVFTNEKFMAPINNILSFGKFRLHGVVLVTNPFQTLCINPYCQMVIIMAGWKWK